MGHPAIFPRQNRPRHTICLILPNQIESTSSLICFISDVMVLPEGKKNPGEEKGQLIQAVRPVGCAPLAVQCCALAVPLAVRLRLVSLNRLYIPWHKLSLLLALLERSDPGKHPTPVTCLHGDVPAHIAAGALTLFAADHREPVALDPWRPWPARGPFVDEIKRWWPSDETLSDKKTVVMDTGPADLRPQFVLWPANGGLLDTWV